MIIESDEELREVRRGFGWSIVGVVAFYTLLAWPAVATDTVDTWISLFAMSVVAMFVLYFYAKKRRYDGDDGEVP